MNDSNRAFDNAIRELPQPYADVYATVGVHMDMAVKWFNDHQVKPTPADILKFAEIVQREVFQLEPRELQGAVERCELITLLKRVYSDLQELKVRTNNGT